ncbi:MAG: hypothetical protein IJT00_01760, partial [Lachnospiraceae bacterium]|nr:hypothetical protein [Lachnospiraceae bacterium]
MIHGEAMGNLTGKILAIVLTGILMAGQPVYAVTPGDGVPGQAAGRGPSTCPVMPFERTESACDAREDLSPAGSGDISGIKAPQTEDGVSTWDCVWFGRYWQDTDSDGDGLVTREDTKDPVKWRVLSVDEEGVAVLMADRLLDIIEFEGRYTDDDPTWERSVPRSFLNSYGPAENHM